MPRSIALTLLLLTSMVSVSRAEICQRPNELIGRWSGHACDMAGLDECAHDPLLEWWFSRDGVWVERQADQVLHVGTWCVVPCELPSPECRDDLLLRIETPDRPRLDYVFGICTNEHPGARNCPNALFPEPRALTSSLVQVGDMDVIDEAILIWKYAGRVIANDVGNWSLLKARFR